MNAILRAVDLRLIHAIRPHRHAVFEELVYSSVVPSATYSPWLSDREFLDLHSRIRDNTLVDIQRCYELWQLARQLDSVPGAFLEVGVWRGGTGAILATAAAGRLTYLADTFKGVVKAGVNDPSYTGGEHADASESDVRFLTAELGLRNVRILQGVFPDATGSHIDGPLALLHCDVDVYQSTKDVIEWAWPRLSTDGIIVLDDYGFAGTEGVARFVNEFRFRQDCLFIHNLNGHAILVKRSAPEIP